MMKKATIISALFFMISFSCYAQVVDTLYSYDIFMGGFSIKEMNRRYYSPIYSVGDYDTKAGRHKDSTSVEFDFKSHGCMSFRKYYNGVLYLEGAYDSSDSSEVRESQGIDVETNELLEPVLKRIYYPIRCGEWKFHLNGIIKERINFEKCKCQ